jgi:uncharacterized protein (DUF58 family)
MTVVNAPVAIKAPAVKRTVQPRHGFDVSLTGLVFVCMMMFMGLAAANSQASLLFGVFGLMIGILLVSASISKWVLKKLEIKRDLPDQASVGQPVALQYTIKNTKRFWPSLSITVSELDGAAGFDRQPMGYLLHVASGMTASITGEFTPMRRGLHTFDRYQISTSFPFGFIKRAVARRQPESLLVFPPVARVKPELMKLFKSAESYGNNLRPRTGGDDEFYGLRDYRHGENPRRIYWKRSAHMGKPVVKEMTHVAPPRLIVVVDNFLTATPTQNLAPQQQHANEARVEKTIAIAASLVKSALDSGLAVGLVACNGRPFSLHISRGKRHERELLTALAKLPHDNTTADRESLRNFASTTADHGTSVVICSVGPGSDIQTVRSRIAGTMVISCDSHQTDAWFNFEQVKDFHTLKPTG